MKDQKEEFYDDEGWNQDALEEIGLIENLAQAQRLRYEIDNCVRGSFVGGEGTLEDLINEIESIESGLREAKSALEDATYEDMRNKFL